MYSCLICCTPDELCYESLCTPVEIYVVSPDELSVMNLCYESLL